MKRPLKGGGVEEGRQFSVTEINKIAWESQMDNIPHITAEAQPFINQDNTVVPSLVFSGYLNQARVFQFMKVSQFKYMLKPTPYINYNPS